MIRGMLVLLGVLMFAASAVDVGVRLTVDGRALFMVIGLAVAVLASLYGRPAQTP